jgi:hypothetical protein
METTTVSPETNGKAPAKKPRAKRVEDSRYPFKINCGVTIEMADAIRRMLRGPYKQSQIYQMILHEYFMRNDPLYVAAINSEAKGKPNG